MFTSGQFSIRQARPDDVSILARLEREKFGPKGTDVYDEQYFNCWLEVNPEGLLVATIGDQVVGYRYSQYVNFTPSDISALTTHNAFTDDGFTRSTHIPNGNSINGVSVCSMMRGAGRVLFEVIFDQLIRQGRRNYFGFSRIEGFHEYCLLLEEQGVDTSSIPAKDLVTWYAYCCAEDAGGFLHDTVDTSGMPRNLPKVAKPDPVLSKYLKHQGFGVAAILPGWMKDPQSHGFGVMVLFKNPNL